jgi:2'-5' RNA ligase superfamily
MSAPPQTADEYAAAWRMFEGLERVAPHREDWARWANGRRLHTLLMALVEDAGAVAAIAQVQARLEGLAGLELHAQHFFHISLQTCGFGHELAVDHVRVEEAVSGLKPFQVELGGVNAFHSAVFLETHSAGQLLALRRALRDGLGPRVHGIDPHDGFLFHLTVGYLQAGAEIGAIRERIKGLREHKVATLTIEQVALVEVPTDQQVAFPRLEPIRTFALAGR